MSRFPPVARVVAAVAVAPGRRVRRLAAVALVPAARRRRRSGTAGELAQLHPAGRDDGRAARGGGAPRMPPGVNLPGLCPADRRVQARPDATASTSRSPTTRVTLRLERRVARRGGGNAAEVALGKYGPIALYVGGTGVGHASRTSRTPT